MMRRAAPTVPSSAPRLAVERPAIGGSRYRVDRRPGRSGLVGRGDGKRADRVVHGHKLRWLAGHEPERAARTAAVMLPHDWLTWRLRQLGWSKADDPLTCSPGGFREGMPTSFPR